MYVRTFICLCLALVVTAPAVADTSPLQRDSALSGGPSVVSTTRAIVAVYHGKFYSASEKTGTCSGISWECKMPGETRSLGGASTCSSAQESAECSDGIASVHLLEPNYKNVDSFKCYNAGETETCSDVSWKCKKPTVGLSTTCSGGQDDGENAPAGILTNIHCPRRLGLVSANRTTTGLPIRKEA